MKITFKLPVAPTTFQRLLEKDKSSANLLIPSEAHPFKFWESMIRVIDPVTVPNGATENTWISFWDDLITRPLCYWEPAIIPHRDSSNQSDTGNKCPNNVPLYQGKGLFRGEEKAFFTQGNPEDELTDKLVNPWPFKGTPLTNYIKVT